MKENTFLWEVDLEEECFQRLHSLRITINYTNESKNNAITTLDRLPNLRFYELDGFSIGLASAVPDETVEERLLQAMQQRITSGVLVFGRIHDRFVSRRSFADARREYQRQKRSWAAAAVAAGGQQA